VQPLKNAVAEAGKPRLQRLHYSKSYSPSVGQGQSTGKPNRSLILETVARRVVQVAIGRRYLLYQLPLIVGKLFQRTLEPAEPARFDGRQRTKSLHDHPPFVEYDDLGLTFQSIQYLEYRVVIISQGFIPALK
jgi:hypothetical protein